MTNETIDTAALAEEIATEIEVDLLGRPGKGVMLCLSGAEARALAALLRGVVDGPKVKPLEWALLVPANPTREQALRFLESAARNVPFLGPWDDMVDDLKDGLRAISLPSPPLSTTKEG